MSTPAIVPGLELAEAFHREVVGPLLGEVRHSAASIGTGSDVLGFDTARSTDHGWGPRLQVFVDEADVAALAAEARAKGLRLVTTEKDWVRIAGRGLATAGIAALPVTLAVEDGERLTGLVAEALARRRASES